MERTSRLIPESVPRHKNPAKREKLLKTYFEMNRKSKRLAFSWWFFLWPIAAHRIYLNQYKSAAIVILLSLISFGLMAVESEKDHYFGSLLVFAIFLAEGMLLIVSVTLANNRIRKKLTKEIESVPYVPLSDLPEKDTL